MNWRFIPVAVGRPFLTEGFFIGGYGYGLATDHLAEVSNPNPLNRYELQFGHGGLWLGYNFAAQKAVHFSFSLMAGAGGINVQEYNQGVSIDYINSTNFVMTPTAGVELNLFSWMRIGTTAGYQYVAAGTSPDLARDLSSPVLQLQFKFGYFAVD